MAANISIVDRVVERLKASAIGDLICEEDLHDITKEAIPKVFFEKRSVVESPGSYNSRTVEKEPLIYEIMRQELEKHVRSIVEEWVANNKEMMLDYWKEVMDKGIYTYVRQIEEAKAKASVRSSLGPLVDAINQERSSLGPPPIYIF